MNDISNLMNKLHSQVEYKEFNAAARTSEAHWPLLDRIGREAAEPAPLAPPVLRSLTPRPRPQAPPPERQPGARRRSLLDRYAAPTSAPTALSPEDARRLPLAEVFARLERAGA